MTEEEWAQQEQILDLGKWVSSEFNRDTISEWFSSAYKDCDTLEKFQDAAITWVEGYIELFEKLLKQIEDLEVDLEDIKDHGTNV